MSEPAGLFDAKPVCAVGAMLGEGPVWDTGDDALWFVDIEGRAILRFRADTGQLERWPAPARPCWTFRTTRGALVVGLETGLHTFDPGTGRCTFLAPLDAGGPGNRPNDAAVASDGSLWFTTMNLACAAPAGGLYRFAGGACHDIGMARVPVANGPAFSPDGSMLYHVDTLGRTVWRARVQSDGSVGDVTRFVQIEDAAGYPDGPTVDAAGNLWIGLYDGWAARCYSPAGVLLRTVHFPVAHVTKLAFGGEDGTIVFATTVRQELDRHDLDRQPHAGDLFAFRADIAGAAVTRADLGDLA